jgi:hypothetical protein
MPKVIADISMSLEGFVTGDGADEQHGLGDAPELHTPRGDDEAVVHGHRLRHTRLHAEEVVLREGEREQRCHGPIGLNVGDLLPVDASLITRQFVRPRHGAGWMRFGARPQLLLSPPKNGGSSTFEHCVPATNT